MKKQYEQMELTDKQKKAAEVLTRIFYSPLGQEIAQFQKERAEREGPISKKKRSPSR